MMMLYVYALLFSSVMDKMPFRSAVMSQALILNVFFLFHA